MLRFKVKEMLLSSGKANPATWLMRHCEMNKTKAYNIVNGKQKSINLKDFSKLCENLNCTPNDLMYWEQTARTQVQTNHPCITQLTPPVKNSDWKTIFKSLTPEKILELNQMALDEIDQKRNK